MNGHRYTPQRAEQLLPILRSIAREIGERTRAIEGLEESLEPSAHARSARAPRDLGAELAHHRRELRFAKQELARFGCTLIENCPLRILIPGEDGELESGFTWTPAEDRLRRREFQPAS
jgi:Uncharacterized conserved protein (DUF2203)